MIQFGFEDELFDEESRQNTPSRLQRMMEEFKEWREWSDLERGKGVFKSDDGYNDLVVVKDIPFTSFCSHHLMPFRGTANIAYLPDGYIVGLSKIPRTVRKFASMPQLQERMGYQIADYLMTWIPQVQGVMVYLEAEHSCMEVRGARMKGMTCTSALRGIFRDKPELKSEALKIMGK